MSKQIVRWSEVATYEVEIETDLTPEQLVDSDAGSEEGLWFDLVEAQHSSWYKDSLLEVSERTVIEIVPKLPVKVEVGQ